MAGKVKVCFKVSLELFSSGIWYGKLVFLKIIFKENFIYLKNFIWIYSRICLIGHLKGLEKSDDLSEVTNYAKR